MEAGISRSRWFPDRGSFPGLQTAAFLLGFDTSFLLNISFQIFPWNPRKVTTDFFNRCLWRSSTRLLSYWRTSTFCSLTHLYTFHNTWFIVDNLWNSMELNVTKIWAVQLLSYVKVWDQNGRGSKMKPVLVVFWWVCAWPVTQAFINIRCPFRLM